MKQTIRVARKPVRERIDVPSSKSITNRALLLAALSEGVSEISNILVSDDTLALLNALGQLGVAYQFDKENRSCIVGGCSGRFPKQEATVWCQNAGTVARFLLAICAGMPGKFLFDGTEQLRARPIAELLQALVHQGARVVPEHVKQMPFVIEGTENLRGGEIKINGAETGQFISALLMIAPFAKTPMIIEAHNLVSKPFVDMTCAMMGEFDVMVHRLHQERYSVPVPQRYMARNYVIEPDVSTASYFFAAAAVTAGQVTIQPLSTKKSKQGDVKFLEVLGKMGCRVVENTTGLTVKGPTDLRGVSVDMRDYSDTFMTLAAIAPYASTPTTITNIGHTRLQESNRIAVMREELEKLGVRAEEGPDWLRIYPGQPKGGVVNPHNDHRIAMAFSILGLRTPGIEIMDAECVAKTCPNFFELLDAAY